MNIANVSTASSNSLKKESHGSGGRLEDDMIELLHGKVCQQVPVPCRFWPMLAQPGALGWAHRFEAGLIAVLRYAADDSAVFPTRVQNLPSTRAFRATRFALNHSCL